jgi:hypothetical protein
MRASPGVHLGIRPYTNDCHTDEFANEFAAPMVGALAAPNEAGGYKVSASSRCRTSVGPSTARRWHTTC